MNYQKECIVCHSEFSSKHIDAKFCGKICQKAKERGTFTDLHYAINEQYLEAKSKRKFILDIVKKAASDKELRACLLTRAWNTPYRGMPSVQKVLRHIVEYLTYLKGANLLNLTVRLMLLGKVDLSEYKIPRKLFLNKVPEPAEMNKYKPIHASTVDKAIRRERGQEWQKPIKVVTYDNGWKVSGKSIGNLANLKSNIRRYSVRILTNDPEASRFLRKEGFMVKLYRVKNEDEIIKMYKEDLQDE